MNAKRLWITMMLVGAIVMGVSWYAYKPQPQPAADANQKAGGAAATSSAPASGASATQAAGSAQVAAPPAPTTQSATAPASATSGPARAYRPRWRQDKEAPPQWVALGSLVPGEGYPFRLEITTEGAAIGTLKLTDYFATVADKKLAARCGNDRAAYEKYEKEVRDHPDKYGGNYCLLNPVAVGAQRHLPLATRRISVWLDGKAEPDLAIDLDNTRWRLVGTGPDGNQYVRTGPDGNQVVQFEWRLYQDPDFADPEGAPRDVPFLKVVKTYQVRKKDCSVSMSLEVVNESNGPLSVAIEQYGPIGLPRESPDKDDRVVLIGKVKESTPVMIFKPCDHLPSMPLAPSNDANFAAQLEPVGYSQEGKGLRMLWIGQADKFFGAILYPQAPADANLVGWPSGDLQFSVAAALEHPQSRTYLTCVRVGVGRDEQNRPVNQPLVVAVGQPLRLNFDLFAGPKKRDLFNDVPLYSRLRYIDTIEFGSCGWCAPGWLSLAMMWLLQFLSKITLGNYGVAIILLVILVRLLLHPLTRKGQVMMSKMHKLGPAIEKLKAKYADNKEQLQKEMFKFQKEQGFTPLLGCLPMMLQMPIWIALWGALSAAVELRHAAFLPFWLTDLSAPDAILHFPFALPITGWRDLNLLPLLGCVSTFVQMKYSPQSAPATTPDAKRQQAMMKYMMPIMMMFLFYTFPSGLNLYIMVSGFLAAIEQYVIRNHMEKKEAQAAVTMVAMPGKGSRSSRPKKPKGPYWFKRG